MSNLVTMLQNIVVAGRDYTIVTLDPRSPMTHITRAFSTTMRRKFAGIAPCQYFWFFHEDGIKFAYSGDAESMDAMDDHLALMQRLEHIQSLTVDYEGKSLLDFYNVLNSKLTERQLVRGKRSFGGSLSR